MNSFPSIDPQAICDISSKWLKVIKSRENILAVFPRMTGGYRRIESMIRDRNLLHEILKNEENYIFFQIKLEMQANTISNLKKIFDINRNVADLSSLQILINKKFNQNKKYVFCIYFIDNLLEKNEEIFYWLNEICEKNTSIQYLFLTEANIAEKNNIFLISKYHKLFQFINYVPLYSQKDLLFFIKDYSNILERNINSFEAEKIVKIVGNHIGLVKEAVRLIYLNGINTEDITNQISYKIKLNQVWQLFSEAEKNLARKILNNEHLPTFTNEEKLVLNHLQNLGWISESAKNLYLFNVHGFEEFTIIEEKKSLFISNNSLMINLKNVDHYFSEKEKIIVLKLIENDQKSISKEEIANLIWINEEYSDWAIDKVMNRLRNKLKKTGTTSKIRTLKKRGYIWER